MKEEKVKRILHISSFMRPVVSPRRQELLGVVEYSDSLDNKHMEGSKPENGNANQHKTSDKLVFNKDGDAEMPFIEIKREESLESEDDSSPASYERPKNLLRSSKEEVNAFLQCIVNSERKGSFDILHDITVKGNDIEIFLSMVICELDRVRSMRLGNGVDRVEEYLMNVCSFLSDVELEEVVVLLTRGVDHSYRSPQTGVKVATLRVLDFVHSINR